MRVRIRHKSARAILAHPRFAQARRAHIEALTGMFVGNRFLIRLLADAGRLMTADLLVGLHAAHDDGDRATWATLGRMQRLIARQGLASPRRLNDLIARLRQTGHVKSVASAADRRIRILEPTERLLAHDRAYVAALHQPLNILYPRSGYERVVRQDARVHLAIRKAGFHALPTATAFISRHPSIMGLLARDAGYCTFLLLARILLLDSAPEGEDLSYTAIAKRLGVSRTHVRNLLLEAAGRGHVTLAAGRVVAIRPQLWEAFDRFLADMESGHDAIAQAAFASLKSASNGTIRIKTQ